MVSRWETMGFCRFERDIMRHIRPDSADSLVSKVFLLSSSPPTAMMTS